MRMIKTRHNLMIGAQSQRYIRSVGDIMQIFYPSEKPSIKLKREAATRIYEAIKNHPKNELSDVKHLTDDIISENLLKKCKNDLLDLGLIGYTEDDKLAFYDGFLKDLAGISKAIESYMKPEILTPKRKAMKLRHIMSKKALAQKR